MASDGELDRVVHQYLKHRNYKVCLLLPLGHHSTALHVSWNTAVGCWTLYLYSLHSRINLGGSFAEQSRFCGGKHAVRLRCVRGASIYCTHPCRVG